MTLQPYTTQPIQTVAALDDGQVQIGPLSRQEYEVFRDALPSWKYQIICMMLYNTGMRIGELLALQGRHCRVNGPDYYILVRRLKKRKTSPDYEPLYLAPNLGAQLRNYIQGQKIGEGQRVFPMTRRAVEYAFSKAGLKVLARSVHPHMFRHDFVAITVDGGVPIATVSKLVGHASIKTTLDWYYELSAEKRRFIGERIKP